MTINKKNISLALSLSLFSTVFVSPINTTSALEDAGFTYESSETGVQLTGTTSKDIKELKIPSTLGGKDVTSIGEEAFSAYPKLISVSIPSSVQVIEQGAFEGCDVLSKVEFENAIETNIDTISQNAFAHCYRLRDFTTPHSIKHIGESAFDQCHKLSHIVISDNIETIDKKAFYDCRCAKGRIELPATLVSIGESAFENCAGITGMTFALLNKTSRISSIGTNAFSGCHALAKSLTFPSSIINIASQAFLNCDSLESLTFSASKEQISIGDNAFGGCLLLSKVKANKRPGISSSAFPNDIEIL